MADPRPFWEVYNDTAPEKVREMPDDSLDACHRYFVDVIPAIAHRDREFHAAQGRINLLRDEMQSRALKKRSDTQHQENQTLGQKTLFWAKIGAIAAIAGTLAVLLQDTRFSSFRPATSSQATPASSPQASETPSVTATPE